MKLVRLMQASALVAAGALSSVNASAQDAAAPAEAPSAESAAPAAKHTDEQVFEAFGYLVGQRIGIADLNITEAEKAAALRGLEAAFSGEKGKFSPETFGPEIQRVLGGRQQAAQAKAAEKAQGEAAAYFEELKKNPAVKSTESGLYYEIISEGGQKPKPTDTVKVHYTGKLVDGTVFDSSVQRGEPAEFPLNGVIPGWTEGLQLIGEGGKIKLHIPSKLGYGEQGAGGAIPPNSTLIFDVELLDIKDAQGEAAAAAAAPASGEAK